MSIHEYWQNTSKSVNCLPHRPKPTITPSLTHFPMLYEYGITLFVPMLLFAKMLCALWNDIVGIEKSVHRNWTALFSTTIRDQTTCTPHWIFLFLVDNQTMLKLKKHNARSVKCVFPLIFVITNSISGPLMDILDNQCLYSDIPPCNVWKVLWYNVTRKQVKNHVISCFHL